MILEEKARGSATVLSVAGELDTLDVQRFTDAVVALAAKGRVRIALDLEKLTFINSTGLGSFIREHERLAQAGGALACAAMSKFTAKNFRLLGMDKRIPCFATVDEAVAHLQGAAAGSSAGRVAFRFPDEGAGGKERRAEILEIREDGLSFRIDDLEGIDLGSVFRPGRALDMAFGAEGAQGLRVKGKVVAADAAAGRRLSVRAAFEGLSAPEREAVGRLVRDIRYARGGPADRDA